MNDIRQHKDDLIPVSRDLLEQIAALIFSCHRAIDSAETIAITIRTLIQHRELDVARFQAEMLGNIYTSGELADIEQLDDALWEAINQADKTGATIRAEAETNGKAA